MIQTDTGTIAVSDELSVESLMLPSHLTTNLGELDAESLPGGFTIDAWEFVEEQPYGKIEAAACVLFEYIKTRALDHLPNRLKGAEAARIASRIDGLLEELSFHALLSRTDSMHFDLVAELSELRELLGQAAAGCALSVE